MFENFKVQFRGISIQTIEVKFFAFTEKSLIFQFENETFFSNFQTMCKSRGSSKTVQIVLAKKNS